MSRIAGVLKKAEDEREGGRSGADGNGGEPAAPGPDSGAAVPWELDGVEVARRSPAARGGIRTGAAAQRPGPSRRTPSDGRDERPGRGIVRSPVAPPARANAFGAFEGDAAPPRPPEPPALQRYLEVLRRRWRTGLLLFLIVVCGVTAGVLLRKPVYRASGMLEIRRESTGVVPVDTLFSSGKLPSDDLETQYGILKSRTLAERVLEEIARYRAAAAGTASASRPVAARPRDPEASPMEIGHFRDAFVVNPSRGSRLVEIAFVSEDPTLAAFTVNSVLDTYLQLRMEDAQRTADWLGQQVEAAQRRLEESEGQLQAYIRTRGLQVVETGKGEAAQMANERLQALQESLARAQAERIDRQSAEEATRRLSAARDVDSPVVQNLTVRLADLRRERAKLTSVFHDEYPAVKTLNDQIAELERALSEESRFVVTRGQRDLQAALRKETLLRKALDEQNAVVQALGPQAAGNAGYEALKRELVTNQEQFATLSQKLKDVTISAALNAQNVGVVDRAKVPQSPYGTPLPLTLALTAIVALVVAAGGAFVREHFDTSVRTVADVEGYLGVRTLGAIPSVGHDLLPSRPRRGLAGAARDWRIDDREGSQSPLAEAFATLRSAVLLHEGSTELSRVLLITSAESEEGKTTVSLNLALSLARLEYRVLLIDGNMRFPCVQRAFGLADRPGLVDYLTAGGDWRGALHAQVQPNLDVLAGGKPHVSPADLLSKPRMGALLEAAGREYDFVIVDSPAVLTHPADVHSLAAVVDTVLFTVRQGWTPREVVALALSQLDRVSGVVLNRSTHPEIAFSLQGGPAGT